MIKANTIPTKSMRKTPATSSSSSEALTDSIWNNNEQLEYDGIKKFEVRLLVIMLYVIGRITEQHLSN